MANGVAGFQSGRLTEARKARGLTQTALAEALGHSISSISRWESGTQFPESDALDRLSETLGLPKDYFLKPIQYSGSTAKFFRSMSTATLRARERLEQRLTWLQNISYDLQMWLELPDVDIPDFEVDDFKSLRDSDIEEAAKQCRVHWRLGNGPISDVILVLENAGVIVAYDQFDTNSIDGVSNWSENDNRPYVLLAKDKQTAVRSRFDVAHELGHLVLHRHVDTKKLTNATEFKELERQANRFASAFLLPEESFTSELWNSSLDAFVSLKLRWKVSVAAMIHRCADLNVINEAYATRLWRSRSARRWTQQEPYDDTLDIEKPRLLERSIRLLLSEGGFSVDALLSDIRLAPRDIEALCGLSMGFLSQTLGQVRPMPMPRIRKESLNTQREAKVVPFPERSIK